MISTNIQENYIEFSVFEAGMSDHTGQICIIGFDSKKNPTQTQTHKRNFCEQNLDSLNAALYKENWEEIHSEQDVDKAYNLFYITVRRALKYACPAKKSRLKTRKNSKPLYGHLAT